MKNHMKAESIEQIREHLARGGRVLDHNRDEVDGLGHVCVYYKHLSSIYPIKDLTPEKLSRWELLPIEEEKKVPRSDCEHCNGKGGRWDDESIDQWYWCEHCGAAEKLFASKVESRLRDVERRGRFRNKLMFGQPWSMEEQKEVWELLTGERIEWGRRCRYCGCTGEDPILSSRSCPKCSRSGYTVRPTWMGEVATGDE